MRKLRPHCGPQCATLRKQVEPTYATCKQERLCDLVDAGLLSFCLDAHSLAEYQAKHRELLLGAHELELSTREPMPTDKHAFVTAVCEAHRKLFAHAIPNCAGQFRGPYDEISYGGDGINRMSGWDSDKIEEGIHGCFRRATLADRSPEFRSAAFLEHFFRVHPFQDGNGRIGRFFVQKICRQSKRMIHEWDSSTRGRREYVRALEYAHPRLVKDDEAALRPLIRWIARHLTDFIEDDVIEEETDEEDTDEDG